VVAVGLARTTLQLTAVDSSRNSSNSGGHITCSLSCVVRVCASSLSIVLCSWSRMSARVAWSAVVVVAAAVVAAAAQQRAHWTAREVCQATHAPQQTQINNFDSSAAPPLSSDASSGSAAVSAVRASIDRIHQLWLDRPPSARFVLTVAGVSIAISLFTAVLFRSIRSRTQHQAGGTAAMAGGFWIGGSNHQIAFKNDGTLHHKQSAAATASNAAAVAQAVKLRLTFKVRFEKDSLVKVQVWSATGSQLLETSMVVDAGTDLSLYFVSNAPGSSVKICDSPAAEAIVLPVPNFKIMAHYSGMGNDQATWMPFERSSKEQLAIGVPATIREQLIKREVPLPIHIVLLGTNGSGKYLPICATRANWHATVWLTSAVVSLWCVDSGKSTLHNSWQTAVKSCVRACQLPNEDQMMMQEYRGCWCPAGTAQIGKSNDHVTRNRSTSSFPDVVDAARPPDPRFILTDVWGVDGEGWRIVTVRVGRGTLRECR
jgi:hypothetical protein